MTKLIALLTLALTTPILAQQNPTPIDFSYAGYAAGKPIPTAQAIISVRPTGKDDTILLQNAIDHVAALPLQPDGLRGAILLRPGRFQVSGQLKIRSSGIVLRGSGPTTTIVANGIDRRTLIEAGAEAEPTINTPLPITDEVPTGAHTLRLAATTGLSIGQHIVIRRPSTSDWIKSLGMTGLPGTFANARLDWAPNSHDLVWDRTITALDPATGQVEFDAPITTALEKKYGGGTVAAIQANPPLQNIGIEDLTLESAYDPKNPKDEEHAWIAIRLDNVEDAWVRNITARHFVSSAVFVGRRARRITVADSRSEAPISEPGGYRRQSFLVYGQQTLILRCHSDSAMNDFATGLLAAGPNVFLDDEATNSLEPSGPFEGWASGVLYENVRVPNSKIQMILDQTRAQGAGWTAANSVIWNSTAQSLEAKGPPEAPNFVITTTQPLYKTQLAARNLNLPIGTQPTAATTNIPAFTDTVAHNIPPAPPIHPITIVNGRFVMDDHAVWGENQGEAWWKGSTSPAVAFQLTQSSVSRFMPGQTGPGLTEDLAEFAARIKARGGLFIQVNPGLWYDHRRDAHMIDHEPDGNVWAPFFEYPWARSGQGDAYDGLSKFDVSRYNPWYFQRHREFAKLAAEQGFLVYFDLYNDHNVLEIGPHYADYPWRPANNINDTGLPEPPPYHPGGTRLDVGNEFFSITYPPLRKLHHDYIIHVLDELGDMPNIIFGAAYQFAGPLSFEQFFQDTVAEWEKAHHRTVRIALTTGKNTTDAILADPVRSKQIAVVDMRYWTYYSDGTLWAPPAGINQAFRAQIEAKFPGYQDTPPPTTPQLVYKQVREYRDRFPNIALVPMESGAGPLPILMAGGAAQSSLRGFARGAQRDGPSQDAVIDKFVASYLAHDLTQMNPVDGWVSDPTNNRVLASATTLLIDTRSGPTLTIAKPLPHATYRETWVNPNPGNSVFDPNTATSRGPTVVPIQSGTTINKPDEKEWLLLLTATDAPSH